MGSQMTPKEEHFTRELMVDAIVGKGFYTQKEAGDFTKLGFARFTGNQNNESWEWHRSALRALDLEDLKTIYCRKRPA